MDALTVIAIVLAVYFLPALIGHARRHRNRRALLALNAFSGWTVFGWVAALVWSLHPEPSSYPRCERNTPYTMER